MKKITSLTDGQKYRFPFYVKKWTDIGLCTKRADRNAAEHWCREVYKVAGLKEPEIIFWAESPLGLLMTSKLLKELSKQYKLYKNTDINSVWTQVKTLVSDSVGNSVRNSARNSVRNSARNSVGNSIGDSVKTEFLELGSYGQHDAYWFSFYDFFRNECGLLKETEKLLPLTNLSKETGWHLFYKDIAILSEKPIAIHRDQRGRLHNTEGPAIEWADGYKLYRLDGIRIDDEAIFNNVKNKLNAKAIMQIKNTEIRTVAIKYFGAENMLNELNASVISEKDNEYWLYKLQINDEWNKLLKMKNPSEDKFHYEWVTPECDTVNEALAMRRGIKLFKEPIFKT